MSDYENAVFISYAWGEETHEREAIVNQLDQSLQKRGIKIVRDKRDLGYKGMIREFMQRIGAGNCVVVVISDKYLRSKNCMFELVEIAANKDFANRVFPIVLSDAKIYEAVDRIDYLKHWEQKKADLDAKMRSLKELANIPGISEEMDDYDRFRDEIDRLTTVIKNMNTLSPDILRDSDFQQVYDALIQRMGPSWTASNPSPSPAPATHDLPPGSYIPFPRNAIFTGRVADLEKLSQSLLGGNETGAVINQTITGMGGLGKTQLAVEFAFRHGYQFRGVHWLDLREPDALTSQIASLGSMMRLPNFPPTLPEQAAATLHEWKTNGPRLLILDNFEDLEAANDVLKEFEHSNLKLLITSRRSDWAAGLGLKRLPLDEFSPAESLAFLRNYISEQRESDADLEKLARHLGYLPLALELAGRYLEKQPRLKSSDYLTQLEKALEHKSMQNWKAEQKSLTGHDLSLAQTFAQSWGLVKNESAKKLFIALGYCAPNTPIPYEIIDAALGDEKDTSDDCLTELLSLGLLKDGNSIHPLLAQYAHSFDNEAEALKLFSEAVAELASQTNRKADKAGDYKLFSPLLPHIRSIAEYAEGAVLEPAGTLWNEIGYHIKKLADYAGAKAAYERAIKIWETTFGLDRPQVATGVNNLGSVLQALGDHAGAKAAFERAIKIDEAAFGKDHPSVARDVNNLGGVLKALGDHAGAKAAFERAIKIWETTFGLDHPQVATGVNNLGSALKALGDHAGAKAAFERALNIFENVLGPDHPQVAMGVNNLGSVLQALGDHAGAKAAFERALNIFENVLGPDHPQVATGVNNLGSVLQDLGDHAGAKAAYERALRIFEKYFSPDHPNIKIVRGNLESL
ncbi:MAG: tetratricopeptide repeat protein [Anaerolineales bacterium]